MPHESLINSLYKIGAIQFGEFTLKSGATSPIYVNLRKIISYPTVLRDVSNAMWATVRDYHFDLICGVPYTALPIATCLSLDHNISMILRRKEKKDYGTKQMIEGVYLPQQTCLIIEDVITSGSSIFETVSELRASGLTVRDATVLIDRQQGGIQKLAPDIKVHPILTLTEIMNTLIAMHSVSRQEKYVIEQILEETCL